MQSKKPSIVGDAFEFEEPWEAVEHKDALMEQLESELKNGHQLFGKVEEVMACRVDSDDILVKTQDGYAVVHLTWCRRSQPDLPFPHTLYLESWSQFLNEVYLPDRQAFEREHPTDGWEEVLSSDGRGS